MIQTRTPICSAKVVKKSVAPNGKIVTTFQARYPRWIHAEQRTHRQLPLSEEFSIWCDVPTPSLMEDPNLSRNASSSRAIPVSRMIQDVLEDTAMPHFWGMNQKGMQAGEEINAFVLDPWAQMQQDMVSREFPNFSDPNGEWHPVKVSKEDAWIRVRDICIDFARAYDDAGYHKQIVNRLLEPFSKINVVITATELSNFYALRDHKDAEPHIQILARAMREADEATPPTPIANNEWHLPYVNEDEIDRLDRDWLKLCLVSTARCARVSYLTHDGRAPDLDEDLALAEKLIGMVPLHASPAEHQAIPTLYANERSGNLLGFVQFRKTLSGECQ